MSTLNDDFDRPFEELEPLQWSALRKLCRTSVEYFTPYNNENSVRIKAALLVILEQLDEFQPLYNEITKYASHFDFDEETPGNGYRSFLSMVDKCIIHSEQVCRQMYEQKDSMFSRKNHHMKEIEACSQLLVSLQTFFQYLKILYASSTEVMSDGKLSLFTMNPDTQEILHWTENFNQYCFYGRCIGFQFCNSLKKVLKTVAFAMVSYSEIYYNNDTLLGRCANSVKYFFDPEARARRIVNISRYADISFTQAFWFLNELEILSVVSPSLVINQLISIPPEELILPTLDGGTISVPIPNSHIGKKPIHVRLLSSKRRLGMVGSGGIGGELHGLCDRLIIHSHGGGFVAQTSRSHEMYLHNWATTLGVPILSIDYSLAPEAPYPRALEEVLYTYAWALKHASTLLGSTAEKVIFVGDSAGGNLNLGATLKCLQLNIKRPDGIFMAYTPIFIDFIPSPSRLLSLTDTLLPFGFLVRCMKSYVGADNKKPTKEHENEECAKSDTESFAEVSESDLIALALSPNGDGANGAQKLVSLPSDSTLNSVSLTEVDGIEGPKVQVESREYVSRFLNMYRNSGTASISSPVAENGSVSRNGNVSGQSDKSWSLFGWSVRRNNKDVRQLDMKNDSWEEFTFTVPKDMFISPYLVSDDMLAHIPPLKILTVEFDPFLDDSVMFARKLRSLGNNVALDILPDLPHGFLNFLHVSKEAMEGVEFSAKRIKELLEL
ncbi:hormone-sensitive lipase [Formica exsecta]|uniref:hormone-sensitive lipase n=1 Tax=Formica exsecta TaxID=72781 RepID=UPI00114487FB|nr:hormone-sensitive lipase [Formica exsecta]XP_029666899.1 hormone-sensitive lipase [Formica exsecta]XP_029666900.1 hormone-sensitive lipase [Formica exsecta]